MELLEEIKKSEEVFSRLKKRDELIQYAITLLDTSVSREAILSALVKQGMTDVEATQILKKASNIRKKDGSQKGKDGMICGAILVVIGGVFVICKIYPMLTVISGYLLMAGIGLFFGGLITYFYNKWKPI